MACEIIIWERGCLQIKPNKNTGCFNNFFLSFPHSISCKWKYYIKENPHWIPFIIIILVFFFLFLFLFFFLWFFIFFLFGGGFCLFAFGLFAFYTFHSCSFFFLFLFLFLWLVAAFVNFVKFCSEWDKFTWIRSQWRATRTQKCGYTSGEASKWNRSIGTNSMKTEGNLRIVAFVTTFRGFRGREHGGGVCSSHNFQDFHDFHDFDGEFFWLRLVCNIFKILIY